MKKTTYTHKHSKLAILIASIMLGGLTGCVEGETLNTETAQYTPESRPLGVIAGSDGEFAPGTEVVIEGRLVGTITDESILWKQTEGAPIQIDDPKKPTLSFTAPQVQAIEAYTFEITAVDSNGNIIEDQDGNQLTDDVTITVFDPEKLITLEAEDSNVATLNGTVVIVDETDDMYISGHSGSGHTSDINPGDSVVFNISLEEAGYYTVYLNYAIGTGYGGKVGQVKVNGVAAELSLSETGKFEQIRVDVFNMSEGENTIEVGGGWSYYRVDSIQLLPAAAPAGPLSVEPSLVNPDATTSAINLMEFLTQNYGSSTLSGQTEFPAKVGNEFPLTNFDAIVDATADDAPAIVAFDYMNYSASYNGSDIAGLTDSIIKAHKDKNIIVSALFHWRAPSGNETEQGCFYSDCTSFDLTAALSDEQSDDYKALINDIDTVALELTKLANADIPVLWRPLHEAEGEWFWWGAHGSDALKQLWKIMYERMTNHHQLNNLIWVFTHTQSLSADWYPGDEYVDIVGYDGYAEPKNDDEVTFKSQYSTLKERHNGKKLVALTETGTIPNVQTMHEQNAWWSFFITWNSETWDSSSVIGPQGADNSTIDSNYEYDGVINLLDIPNVVEKVEAGLYENFEASSNDFDITTWEFQNNWSPVDGINLSTTWFADGMQSLGGDVQLVEGDDNVILQTYPANGLQLGSVSTLKVTAHSINAGSNVQVQLFAKDQDDDWRDSGAFDIEEGGVQLSLDISDLSELSGFGVRFIGAQGEQNSPSQFFIDSVIFE
ncbi:glycosyl hydrolase [Pseudoalteromonas shioyasakiensis]|uniref:glycosyl hydrolase n=1 Tax=Pseudoalteromonas shioyasakiensis TaxID=1190813 RepID=UPI002118CF4F|nr:glycosyl hydrolase [Pseudoalteromonas shioyasakiensis]MCQ8877583.1 glycosyl hydrolase [Pseudoalteromonas shioyasakiensis]